MHPLLPWFSILVGRRALYHVCFLAALVLSVGEPASAADSPPLDNFFPEVLTVRSVLPQPDGAIVVGGSGFLLPGGKWTRIARLNSDGTYQPNFTNAIYSPETVNVLTLQDDSMILFGQASGGPGRLTIGGSYDPAIYVGLIQGGTRALLVKPSGEILMGGTFTTTLGLGKLVLLNPTNGAVSAPVTRFSVTVNSLAPQPDGKLVVAGDFIYASGGYRNRIARLNSDGTLDQDFDPNVAGGTGTSVSVAAVQHDGKVIFGGTFNTVAGQPRASLARVLSDGSLDASFNPGVTGTVYCIVLQADGKIIVGGTFTSIAGQNRQNLARGRHGGSGWWFQRTVQLSEIVPLQIVQDASLGIHNHHLRFNVSGPAGHPFWIESSTDLKEWLPIWTNDSPGNPVLFTDPRPADEPQRMYRVRYQ